MKAIAAYMANKTREGGNERRSEYSDQGRREYENRSEYGGTQNRVYNANDQRQTNQYSARNGMDENWPQDNEMRRRRDSNGRYMTDYDGGAESRYRGRDGRWKAGRRRSEYEEGAYGNGPMDRRMGEEEDDEEEEQEKHSVTFQPKNVIQWPYGPRPHMPPESRMIGFGNRPREYETRSHYDGGRQEAEVGGRMWMEPVREQEEDKPMDRQSMEKWVEHMRDDKDKPVKPWSVEEVKPIAARFGYPTFGEKFDVFFTAIHMMKSDYCAVAEEFDVNVPAFYAALADAWLKDPDAALQNREKLEAYHKYIVMGRN